MPTARQNNRTQARMPGHPGQKIGIAGGGLLGRLCAWQLLLAGHQVSIFDKDPLQHSTAAGWTAAGMLSPLSELASADRCIYEWGCESLQLWPRWLETLAEHSRQKVSFQNAGSIVVAHPRDEAELPQFIDHIRRKLNLGEALLREAGVHLLDKSALHALEPCLGAQFERALFLENEGHLHSRELMTTVQEAILQLGGKWHASSPVLAVKPGTIELPNRNEYFDRVVDTRGLGAKNDLPELRGVRGEVMLLECKEVTLNRPVRLLHPRYKLYAVPRAGHQVFIGATEIESEDLSPICLRSSLELGSALYALNPAFSEARIIESASNCRPALPDNLPLIDYQEGLLRINGLYRHGYLLAPAVIRRALSRAGLVDPQTDSHSGWHDTQTAGHSGWHDTQADLFLAEHALTAEQFK
jgi:glycine oxidase